ncbi:cellulose binding domain-containing protein [Lentzea sp. NPDC058450]|uniref:cellulose binding domain-containing protein n=1 Tax=Lentzea sp. NPDC058450 TaxID=3346505 RepID=UPI0036467B38
MPSNCRARRAAGRVGWTVGGGIVARGHLLAMLLLLTACTAEPAAEEPAPAAPTPTFTAPTLVGKVVPPQDVLTVVRDVIDGRTVEFVDGTRVRIALLAEPKECFAKSALDFAKSTLLATSVRYTVLTLGEVNLELEDGTDYAVLAVQRGALRPEGVDGGPLIAAQEEAKVGKRGLWGPPCEGSDTPKPTTTTTTPPPPPPTTTTPPPPPRPAKACSVSYRITGQWQGGFQASVIVRNTGTEKVTNWSLLWSFSNGESVQSAWDASVRQYSSLVSATNTSYNQQIASGGSVQFGFNGNARSGARPPTAFVLNNVKCAIE